MKKLFAGIDQGTSGTKGILVDEEGKEHFHTVIPISLFEKENNIVEQNPDEILESVKRVLSALKKKASELGLKIEKAGLSCQRSGVLAWDKKTGKPLSFMMSWADTRMKSTLMEIKGSFPLIEEKACLPVLPGFAAPKIAYMQREFNSNSSHVGTLDSFLIYNLIKPARFVTDDSMASRTLLYNPRIHAFDRELIKLFKVDASRLPEIIPSCEILGEIDGVLLSAMVADQQASLIGRRNKSRKILLNLGSILSLLIDQGSSLKTKKGFSSNIIYSFSKDGKKEFAHTFEGTSPACAGVFKWAREFLGNIDVQSFDNLAGSTIPTDKNFPTCYYPKGGTGSPSWREEVPPVIENWDGKDKEAFARATLENIVGFIMEIVEEIFPNDQSTLMVSGGLSKSDYLMRFLADVSGKEILLSESPNASARGAALLAIGDFTGILNEELKFKHIKPQTSKAFDRLTSWRKLKKRLES